MVYYHKTLVPCSKSKDGETPTIIQVVRVKGVAELPFVDLYMVLFNSFDLCDMPIAVYRGRDRAIEEAVFMTKEKAIQLANMEMDKQEVAAFGSNLPDLEGEAATPDYEQLRRDEEEPDE